MLQSINNISIFRRLFIAFALAAVIPNSIIFVLCGVYVNLLYSRGDALRTTNKIVHDADRYFSDLQLTNRLAIGLLSPGNNTAVASVSSAEGRFNIELALYQKQYQFATSPDMRGIARILRESDNDNPLIQRQQQQLNRIAQQYWPQYKAELDQMLAAVNTMNQQPLPPGKTYDDILRDANAHLVLANNLYRPLEQSWKEIVSIAEQVNIQIARVGPSQINPLLFGTVISFVFTTAVVLAIGHLMNLSITGPLRQLAMLTRRIAKGETTARVKLVGQDEIYMVARSMNEMLDNIVNLIQVAQQQRDLLQSQVEKLVREVSGVAEGDLRVEVEVASDALGVLADSFNYMIEELSSLVVRVKLVAQEVANSTSVVIERMNQLVETNTTQMRRMDGASNELGAMTMLSRDMSLQAYSLSRGAQGSLLDAQEGQKAVEQVANGIGRIQQNVQTTAARVHKLDERSREINSIVEVISGLVYQTNRLALDASIQAATAGNNGRGFGSVAADIRYQAERSKEEATRITRIVRGIREDIDQAILSIRETERETEQGAVLTQDVGKALASIFSIVERQERDVMLITRQTEQQLDSARAVAVIMEELAMATQESNVRTRDVSRGTEQLAGLVDEMRSSVAAFKLREENRAPLLATPTYTAMPLLLPERSDKMGDV